MFEVGDNVKIIDDLKTGRLYHEDTSVIDAMLEYAGMEAKVTAKYDDLYELSCDDGEWYWPEKTLILCARTNGNKIRNMTDEELADFISCPYKGNEKYHDCENGCFKCCLEWIKKTAE